MKKPAKKWNDIINKMSGFCPDSTNTYCPTFIIIRIGGYMVIWIDLFVRIVVQIECKDAGFQSPAHKDIADINARNAEHGAEAEIPILVKKPSRIS